MAIPEKDLSLKYETTKLTIDEACLFEPGGWSLVIFRQFLRKYSNWTSEEIGNLEIGELESIADQIKEAVLRVSVPLES